MPRSCPPDRVVVGKFTGLYGIKGWIKVHSYTDPPHNLFDYLPWFITDPASGKEIRVDSIDFRPHGKGYIAHLAGVDDRDSALAYCSRLVSVDRHNLPTLPAGEYYWQQLTGLKVLSSFGQAPGHSVLLGKATGLMETGANDVIVVGPCENSIDQRERLLPYADPFVLQIDLGAGTMLVDWDPDF